MNFSVGVTVKVYDKGRKNLLQTFTNVPDEPGTILNLIGASMGATDDPDQEFMIRVDGSASGGYWMNVKARDKK